MRLSRPFLSFSRHVARSPPSHTVFTRRYSAGSGEASRKNPSPHAQFYSSLLPDMVPIAILGSAVYLVRPPP